MFYDFANIPRASNKRPIDRDGVPPKDAKIPDLRPAVAKEAFKRYLQSSGVYDAVSKAFSALYEESAKPLDPLAYVISRLNTYHKNQTAELFPLVHVFILINL